jgi:putative ubiquitin-RnfH superfamily antitoxin RatB of RatAB toxin-antitoxin module
MSNADAEKIVVEVVYGDADRQKLLSLDVVVGTTVYAVAEQSGIVKFFPELDLANASMGIFGKVVAKPKEQIIRSGERVEIYRPLLVDPMESRKARAAKVKARRDDGDEENDVDAIE